MRKHGRQAVFLLLASVFFLATGSTNAYIDIPPATLGRMCEATMSITVLRVDKFDRDGGRLVYRAVRDLKGNGPSDLIKHVVGKDDKVAGQVLRWAEAGKVAIHFASASRNYSYTYVDGHWYSSTYAEGWWRLVRGEPQLLHCFCGTVQALIGDVESIMAGKEVVVPCLARSLDKSDKERSAKPRPAPMRVQRLRASLKRLDNKPERDFVAWGSADGITVGTAKEGLTVRVGDSNRSIPWTGLAIFDDQGRALEEADAKTMLRPGATIEINELAGQVVAVRVGRR